MESRIELVKLAFQKMNLEGLKVLLNDSDILFQTDSQTFFSLIEETFEKAKQEGDNHFRMLDNIQGFPEIEGKTALRFFGIPSLCYFEFLMYSTEDEKIVLETFDEENSEYKWPTLGKHFTFFIDERRKLLQFQEEDIINDLVEADKAVFELKELQKEVRNLSAYVEWIDKYTSLFEKNKSIDQNIKSEFYLFFSTFLKLRKLKNFSLEIFTVIARNGYAEFQSLNHSNMDILSWLCRYERVSIWFISYYNKSIFNNGLKDYFEHENCKIAIENLEEVLKFVHNFTFYNKRYYDQFNKMTLAYDLETADYFASQHLGFYEANLKQIGISVEPIKIHTKEEPIERFYFRQLVGL